MDMPLLIKYSQINYTQGWITLASDDDLLLTKPSWWRRVFLHEKPKPTKLALTMAAQLGSAVRQVEEKLIRDIFTNGRQTPNPTH